MPALSSRPRQPSKPRSRQCPVPPRPDHAWLQWLAHYSNGTSFNGGSSQCRAKLKEPVWPGCRVLQDTGKSFPPFAGAVWCCGFLGPSEAWCPGGTSGRPANLNFKDMSMPWQRLFSWCLDLQAISYQYLTLCKALAGAVVWDGQ